VGSDMVALVSSGLEDVFDCMPIGLGCNMYEVEKSTWKLKRCFVYARARNSTAGKKV